MHTRAIYGFISFLSPDPVSLASSEWFLFLFMNIAKYISIRLLAYVRFVGVFCLISSSCLGCDNDAKPSRLMERSLVPPFKAPQITSLVEYLREGIVVARKTSRLSRDGQKEEIIEFRLGRQSWAEYNITTGVDVVKADDTTLCWKAKDSISVATRAGNGGYFEVYFVKEGIFLDGEERSRLQQSKAETMARVGPASGL